MLGTVQAAVTKLQKLIVYKQQKFISCSCSRWEIQD
jgi:hypothetical protein